MFIDFRQAYDSIEREKLYIAIRKLEIPEKLVRLVRTTIKRTEVQQRDGLAPLLFNIATEYTIRRIYQPIAQIY